MPVGDLGSLDEHAKTRLLSRSSTTAVSLISEHSSRVENVTSLIHISSITLYAQTVGKVLGDRTS